MKTRDLKAPRPSDSSFNFWPGRSSVFAIARLFWMALGPGTLMILCVLRMDADAPNRLFLSSLYVLTVFAMLTARWLFFLSPRRDRHRFRDEWKNVMVFSAVSVCLSAGIWLVAETVSDAQSMSVESTKPVQDAPPMLSEGEMLTQTL